MASDASEKARMEKLFSFEGGEQLSSGAGGIAGGSRCECPRCHGFGDERVGLRDKSLRLKVLSLSLSTSLSLSLTHSLTHSLSPSPGL